MKFYIKLWYISSIIYAKHNTFLLYYTAQPEITGGDRRTKLSIIYIFKDLVTIKRENFNRKYINYFCFSSLLIGSFIAYISTGSLKSMKRMHI